MLQLGYEEISREAARIVAGAVRREPSLTLGLATGQTMAGTYRELVRMHQYKGWYFSQVVTFNLDEYVGLSPDHPPSFQFFHTTKFLRPCDHVNLSSANVHIPWRFVGRYPSRVMTLIQEDQWLGP